MKNLILFADGTGNSGGAVNSNVWRACQAIDRTPPIGNETPQFTFYDEGVGTQESKLGRAIASGTGYGVDINVRQIYQYLIQHYEPGDKIFMFGFSRGAFTVRVVANLLFYCGLANKNKGLPPGQSGALPEDVARLARMAVAAYKRRHFSDPHRGHPAEFRKQYGLSGNNTQANIGGEPGWFPIHFIGVWDTVDAYGLPINELANTFTDLFRWTGLYWLSLRFKEQFRLRENDLHPLIVNGYHALAIDDERHAFHPKMWIEKTPLDPRTMEPLKRANETVMKFVNGAGEIIAPPAERDIQQVWFTGMHSNVGGGYPQDQLAHVSLLWMMEKAAACGLRFNPNLWAEYQQTADVNGRMHDSRLGVGVIYRYRPRDLAEICASAGLTKPTLHEAVLKRTHQRNTAYAPTGVPAIYDIVPVNSSVGVTTPTEVDPELRLAYHKQVDGLVWLKEVFYLATVGSIALLLWLMWSWDENPQTDAPIYHSRAEETIAMLIIPMIEFVMWASPYDYFEGGWFQFRYHPFVFCGFLLWLGVAIIAPMWLSIKIKHISSRGWATGLGDCVLTCPPRRPLLLRMRTLKSFHLLADIMQYWIVPYGLMVLTLWGIGYILIRQRTFAFS